MRRGVGVLLMLWALLACRSRESTEQAAVPPPPAAKPRLHVVVPTGDDDDAESEWPAPSGAGLACTPLTAAPMTPRTSSLWPGFDCDPFELTDFTLPGGGCFLQHCPPPVQTGDGRCHRVCEDERCAPGEQCAKRWLYGTDTTDGVHPLCVCATAACRARQAGPPAPEGGLAVWRVERRMPSGLQAQAMAASANRLFVAGGLAPGGNMDEWLSQGEINSAVIGADGTLGPWKPAGKLPEPIGRNVMAVAHGRVYVSGAEVHPGSQKEKQLASAAIGPDGRLGAWRDETPMPGGPGEHRLQVIGDVFAVVGGELSTVDPMVAVIRPPVGPHSDARHESYRIWTAAIGARGVVGEWHSTTVDTLIYDDGSAGVAGDRIYLIDNTETRLASARVKASGVFDFRMEGDIPKQRDVYRNLERPVMIHGLCGALVLIGEHGHILTADLDAEGQVGHWRVASGAYGTTRSFASAATASRIYLSGGIIKRYARLVPDGVSARVLSTARAP